MSADPIAAFLSGVQTGCWDALGPLLAADVVYDASVPGWRYRLSGRDAVLAELRRAWTGRHVWRIAEQRLAPTPDGAALELELRGRCPGDEDHAPHGQACRLASVFRLEAGRIAEQRLYCCGEWDEQTVSRIDAELGRETATQARGG